MHSSSLLSLQAGPAALNHFQEHGLHMQDFGYMLAASGGPKWLALSGLDQYLCLQHLPTMQGIQGLGTSAGAFRLACYAQSNPSQAIAQFAKDYINTTYTGPHPRQPERDRSVTQILDGIVHGKEQEILNSPHMQVNWITTQCHGLGQFAGHLPQLANLSLSFLANRLGRQHLRHLYSRACFGAEHSQLQIQDPYQIPTDYYALDQSNLYDSLLASGTIPLFSPLRQNIAGAPGSHLDGGLVDYHFDLQLHGAEKPLVLYPHFSSKPRPGWFDKKLPRPPIASSYDNVLLMTPSPEFLAQLKNSRIPERDDFRIYDDTSRIQAWNKTADLSHYLADELHQVLETQDISRIKPLVLD